MRLQTLLISALLSILPSCGPEPYWGASKPVRIEIGEWVPIPTDTIRAAITDRLSQFEIPVSDAGTRIVRVQFDPACSCAGCQVAGPTRTAAYTTDRIRICDGIEDVMTKTPRGPYLVLGHELGHLLGLHRHLPAGGNLMAPIFDNYRDLSGYSAADLTAICQAGQIASPTCDRVGEAAKFVR